MVKHPDYNIDFIPSIARYDWDQTYDVLKFLYLPRGFDRLLSNCGIPSFNTMVIDRFTPYNYRWADQYSDIIYNFLKDYNMSPYSSINKDFLKVDFSASLSGKTNSEYYIPLGDSVYHSTFKDGGLLPEYPQFVYSHSGIHFVTMLSNKELRTVGANTDYRYDEYDLEVANIQIDNGTFDVLLQDGSQMTINNAIYFPDFSYDKSSDFTSNSLSCTFAKGEYTITALIGKDPLLSDWIDGISDIVIDQVFVTFQFLKDTNVSLRNLINRWILSTSIKGFFCANSMVISKKTDQGWIDYIPNFNNKPDWLLYNDINIHFNDVKNQLNSYFNTRKQHAIKRGFVCPNAFPPQTFFDKQFTLSVIDNFNFYSNNVNVTNAYSDMPLSCKELCYLARANNNKWETGEEYISLGFIFNQYLIPENTDLSNGLMPLKNTIFSNPFSGIFVYHNVFEQMLSVKTGIFEHDFSIEYTRDHIQNDPPRKLYPFIGEKNTGTYYHFDFYNRPTSDDYLSSNIGFESGRGDVIGKYPVILKTKDIHFLESIEYLDNGFGGEPKNIQWARSTYKEQVIERQLSQISYTENITEIGQGEYYIEVNLEQEIVTETGDLHGNLQLPITRNLYRTEDWSSFPDWVNTYQVFSSDQEYLDYLLGLKEEYEELSKTW
ncbi:hypothetical protein VKI21_06955 [Cyanobacterium aponinum UTEX 3222]|uniref:hypothetical protein n=1 Tax=Cyanobacterium aponinum TaxID=379064 RepID=UPI00308B2EEE|nr:hypothetical protein VKI21_06955 [Cyanobacterium aponinum UTEX 3222]